MPEAETERSRTGPKLKSIAFLVDGHDPAALRMLLNQLHAYARKERKYIFSDTSKATAL